MAPWIGGTPYVGGVMGAGVCGIAAGVTVTNVGNGNGVTAGIVGTIGKAIGLSGPRRLSPFPEGRLSGTFK